MFVFVLRPHAQQSNNGAAVAIFVPRPEQNNEIKKMGHANSGLRGDTANEMKLRDKAARSVAELESALQRKIDKIKMTQQKAEGVVQEKNQQMNRMKDQLDKSTAAAGKEAKAN